MSFGEKVAIGGGGIGSPFVFGIVKLAFGYNIPQHLMISFQGQ